MTVTTYVLRRLVQLPLSLLFVSILIFSLMHIAPGDPVQVLVDAYASPQTIEALRREYQLDKSLPEQYLLWLQRLLHGDLGHSIRTGEPVLKMFFDHLAVSLTLTTLAMSLAIAIGIPVGIIAAFKQNTLLDHVCMFWAMVGLAIPNFALALMLILVIALRLDLLPITGIGLVSFWRAPWPATAPFILPMVALGASQTGILARLLRSCIADVLGENYITVARAKGLTDYAVLIRHALKNALIPVITIVAIDYVFLLGSTITIEYVFAIPGIGTVLIQAVYARDFPVIQGCTLFIAVFYMLSNLATDLIYVYIDPRIRYV